MSATQDVRDDDLSQLLVRWTSGDQEALKSLIPLVYRELRRLAHYRLRRESRDDTLETTALVNEAYLRLARNPPQRVADRKHFFAIAAGIMRQILVDHAREKQAKKRYGGVRIELQADVAAATERVIDFVALDEALSELAKLDPRQSKIVELRYFAGLSIEDTSEILGMSPMTVKREWMSARAWLHNEMSKGERGSRQVGAGSGS